MEQEFTVLWKNGELDNYWATSKSEALKLARAYKRKYRVAYNWPLKALTEEEATELIRNRLLNNATR